MSEMFDHFLNEIKKLSLEELLTLQRRLIDEVQTKALLTTPTPPQNQRGLVVPPSFRRNPEEVEAALLAVFGLAQLEAIQAVDLTNLGPGSKTVTEMISEDREDRF